MNDLLSPAEIAEFTVNVGVKKAGLKWWKQFLLGIMAGLFIALAGNASSVAGYGISSAGLSKTLSGALFAAGLLMVLFAGAELFTGNCLMTMAVAEKKIRTSAMLKNWFFVYLGNLVGGVVYTFLMSNTTQMNMGGGQLGAYAINVAYGKCTMEFVPALIMGIFCNVLVCIAVWVTYSTKNVAGKILAMFFPIWIFVASGYEHCVANMYFIPMGIFEKGNSVAVEAAMEHYGLTAEQIASVNWENFFVTNLVPVTIGNIIGGGLVVGLLYWLIYVKKSK